MFYRLVLLITPVQRGERRGFGFWPHPRGESCYVSPFPDELHLPCFHFDGEESEFTFFVFEKNQGVAFVDGVLLAGVGIPLYVAVSSSRYFPSFEVCFHLCPRFLDDEEPRENHEEKKNDPRDNPQFRWTAERVESHHSPTLSRNLSNGVSFLDNWLFLSFSHSLWQSRRSPVWKWRVIAPTCSVWQC